MTSLLDGPRVAPLRGVADPRVFSAPPSVATSGDELADFAAVHGLTLDGWQRTALRIAMGERPDGGWSAFEVGIIVGRQNGKGSIIEARELGGLFLLGEKLIMHTAHQFKTSSEAFLRIKTLIDGSDDLRKRVKRVASAPGDQGIELKNGNRLRFVARSVNGGGRGFSADLIILDEAYRLPQEAMDALLPTLSTIQNPQIWYLSSAGMTDSDVLAGVRARGIAGTSPSLAYMEWSAPADCDPDDPKSWAMANPALGIRISEEFILRERAALSDEGFARERLGIWDELGGVSVISPAHWRAVEDPESAAETLAAFAVEVSLDRGMASIGVAGPRVDGLVHLEAIDSHRGTDWVVPRCVELSQRFGQLMWVVDGGGPGNSLIEPLEAAGLKVLVAQTRDVGIACASLVDAVAQQTVRHGPQEDLDIAVAGAKKRPLGDGAFAFGRKASGIDISALQAVTLAHWAATRVREDLSAINNVW